MWSYHRLMRGTAAAATRAEAAAVRTEAAAQRVEEARARAQVGFTRSLRRVT